MEIIHNIEKESDLANPFAELTSPDSGLLISPKTAKTYQKKSTFYCPDPDCIDPERVLFLKSSPRDRPFFCHRQNYQHDFAPETLLHKSAVRWFIGKTSFEIPDNEPPLFKRVDLDQLKTVTEFRKLPRHVPDVKLMTSDAFEFAVEIFVTNDVKEEKKKIISQFGLPTLRIDLSDFYEENWEKCKTDLDFVKEKLEVLMTDNARKKWVHKSVATSKQLGDNEGCLSIALLYSIGKFFSSF